MSTSQINYLTCWHIQANEYKEDAGFPFPKKNNTESEIS